MWPQVFCTGAGRPAVRWGPSADPMQGGWQALAGAGLCNAQAPGRTCGHGEGGLLLLLKGGSVSGVQFLILCIT